MCVLEKTVCVCVIRVNEPYLWEREDRLCMSLIPPRRDRVVSAGVVPPADPAHRDLTQTPGEALLEPNVCPPWTLLMAQAGSAFLH